MYLFVYGTLKRGHGNHRVLGDAKYIEDASMSGKMYSMGGFPGMIESDGLCDSVFGEIYEIEDRHLPGLDSLEGYNKNNPEYSMYIRKELPYYSTRHGEDGFNYTSIRGNAFVYIWNDDVRGRELIEDGTWR